jgi:uncharacterized cupin superfamily protein
VYQQVWLLEGAIDITLAGNATELREGDCLAMQLDRPTMLHNRRTYGIQVPGLPRDDKRFQHFQ